MHVLSAAESLPAIVYAGTRRDTEMLAEEIGAAGISTVAYHAGLAPERRRAGQESVMSGSAEGVVATNAFGVGVGKADVATGAHWAVAARRQAYYQEGGGGRRGG